MLVSIFFDADALIAGSASRTRASFILLQLCELGLLKGFTCQQVIEESQRNLQKKLPNSLPAFNRIVAVSLSVVDDPSRKWLEEAKKLADCKDVPILAAALQANADYLVTFNLRHYHTNSSVKIQICSPGDLLKNIRILLNQLDK